MEMRVELRQEDMDARKVQVSEVDISVGDISQPCTQIFGLALWITADE